MTITTTRPLWHPVSDADPGADHVIHTLTPEPASWTQGPVGITTQDLIDLTPAQQRAALAHHEAGHAAVFTLCGVDVDRITYQETDDLEARVHLVGGREYSVEALLIGLAAGWTAEVRWLEEAGLYTPVRAWAAERHAHTDQRQADRLCRDHYDAPLRYADPHTRYGDWQTASDAAHTILGPFWGVTARLAEELLARWEEGQRVMPGRLIRHMVTYQPTLNPWENTCAA